MDLDFDNAEGTEENRSDSIKSLHNAPRSWLAAYEDYCSRIEDTAEWGGQLELQALSSYLRLPIWIYSADSPILKMGSENEAYGPHLQLT